MQLCVLDYIHAHTDTDTQQHMVELEDGAEARSHGKQPQPFVFEWDNTIV